jgi:hypothetical protein
MIPSIPSLAKDTGLVGVETCPHFRSGGDNSVNKDFPFSLSYVTMPVGSFSSPRLRLSFSTEV